MAEFQGIGYGIGEALSRAAENLTQNARLQFQERERQADAYEKQARDIAANIAQLGGKDAPGAKPYVDQLQEVLGKHNALYPAGETSTLVQRIGRFLKGGKGPQGQSAATPESVPGMQATTGELLPGQLDTGQGGTEAVSRPAPPQHGLVPPQRLLPRTMPIAGPGIRPPLQWQSQEEILAGAPPRQNAILQELQDLRQTLKAGGQTEEEAGRNAIKAINSKYGVNLPGKPPRVERDPVSHDVIGVTDEDAGGITYTQDNIQNAPLKVQQALNAALRGQEARPPSEPNAVKTEFELFLKQYPNATVEQYAEFKAKETRKGKTVKERVMEEIADAVEKGDRATVATKQKELESIDPFASERLIFAGENLGLREVANIYKQEAAKEKKIAPFRAIVETAANARQLKSMGDAGNGSADVDLTLEFFKVIRGSEGSGIRFSQNEQNFITGARSLSEAIEVRGNQIFANGQPLAREQRQRMVDTIDVHAKAAQRMIDELSGQEAITPATLKERAKPKGSSNAPPRKPAPVDEKESLLEDINK